ncbi:MAG: TfoX/Sxy family protein [Ignavibacteriae bacterium]|nr:TfoX/Sxy family protein [Ignavibacteriota bacterium]
MASKLEFIKYVVGQLSNLDEVEYKYMFGEYALYYNKKVVALICDDQLFVKPTDAGRKFIGKVFEAQAYPGAKPTFLIEGKMEDKDWLSELIKITEKELPKPKPKKKQKK